MVKSQCFIVEVPGEGLYEQPGAYTAFNFVETPAKILTMLNVS